MAEDSWRSAVLRDLGERQVRPGGPPERMPDGAGQARPTPSRPALARDAVGPAAPPPGAPPVARQPVATSSVPSSVSAPLRGDPFARRVLRSTRSLLGAPGEDRDLVEAVEAVRQPVSTGRRIAVAGLGGGGGSTTVALLLASVYAARRADRVLAVDTDPQGELAWRLGAPAGTPGDPPGPPTPPYDGGDVVEDLTGVPRSHAGPWVLPAAETGGLGAAQGTAGGLSRFFAVTVVDVGDAHRAGGGAVLADAHSAVLAAPATPAGVQRARVALESADMGAGLACVVLVSLDPAGPARSVRRALRELRRQGPPCLRLPYDRHLAGRAPVDPGRVAATTVRAGTAVAAVALSRAVGR